MTPVSIIIPTYNNYDYLQPCLKSLLTGSTPGLFNIIVVNNGEEHSCDWIQNPNIKVVNTGQNLGWEGGLKKGLEHTDSPYIVFMNDDTFVPVHQRFWINNLIQHFRHDEVGAIGPSSNVVMGRQNIFYQSTDTAFVTNYLIGFCVMVRRSALDKAGGIDDTLPGGDDIDLSIRLRDAGYKLVADRNVFIYHHGFKTGTRVHGDYTTSGGWNSVEFTEATNLALIKKHGFRKWYETLYTDPVIPPGEVHLSTQDIEGELIRKFIRNEDFVLDLGCGANKTVPHAKGVDMIPKGEPIVTLDGSPTSQADIQADISKPLPIVDETVDVIVARHLLEHMIDPVAVVKNWIKKLKPGGKLILAVPDQNIIKSIPMNLEHVHAYTQESMVNFLKLLRLKEIETFPANNYISFIAIGKK